MRRQSNAQTYYVDVTSKNGLTALHLAIYRNDKGMAKLLLASGADPNHKAKISYAKTTSPLEFAKERGNKEILELLQNHGAKE